MIEVQVFNKGDSFYIMNAEKRPIAYNDFIELRMKKVLYKKDQGWYIKKEALPLLAERGYQIRISYETS